MTRPPYEYEGDEWQGPDDPEAERLGLRSPGGPGGPGGREGHGGPGDTDGHGGLGDTGGPGVWNPAPGYGRPAPPEPRVPDPLAVAVGNASLLGIGYLLMNRRGLFWSAAPVTVALWWLTYATAATWSEVLLVLWWAAVVAHGLWLARRHPSAGPRRGQRVLALALTVPVLAAAGWVRADANGIEDAVAGARADGDCGAAVDAQDGVRFRHRLLAAPAAARGDAVVGACERLDTAEGYLSTALTGDLDSLETGFARLGGVLGEPGNERTVEAALKDFLGQLPTDDGCVTMSIADWLRKREDGPRDLTGPAAATAARITPGALVKCGDALLADNRWADAQDRYQRLLDDHPGDARADDAREGVRKAGLAIELNRIENLVTAADSMGSGYCGKPAKYSAAPAYRKGKSGVVFAGDTEYTDKLPEKWLAGTAAAALVVCTGEAKSGDAIETCQYRGHDGRIGSVRFNKLAVRVKAYALRTGKLVTDRTVQMNGESCPGVLRYFGELPSQMAATPSDADVRDAFGPVIGR